MLCGCSSVTRLQRRGLRSRHTRYGAWSSCLLLVSGHGCLTAGGEGPTVLAVAESLGIVDWESTLKGIVT